MIPKFINNKLNTLVLFDMDGVLVEFIEGIEKDIENEVQNIYFKQRPLNSIIKVANELYQMKNVQVGILSSCNYPSQVIEKKKWLKQYLPFISDNMINIIVWSNENYTKETRCYAKLKVIQSINNYDQIFLIEDTHSVISATNEAIPHCAHHVSELID